MRRVLLLSLCLALLAPSSALCRAVCGEGEATAMPMHMQMEGAADHCGGDTHASAPADHDEPCARCELHAALDADVASPADRPSSELDPTVVAPTASVGARFFRPRPRRASRCGNDPPPPLAIRHAPLLI